VRHLWGLRSPISTSWISFAETSAAIGRAQRSRRLSQNAAIRARRRFETEWGAVAALLVGEDIARLAGRLAVAHALRGMDSIHLASALSIPRLTPVVVTADVDLARAASSEGLTVAFVG
jgi:predicted nucleic acid-binding protein